MHPFLAQAQQYSFPANPVLQEYSNKMITVRTTFVAVPGLNPADNTRWPKVSLYLNNATGYEGLVDLSSCATAAPGCGTPNLYQNKFVTEFTVDSLNAVKEISIPLNKLIVQMYANDPNKMVTKFSYVYHNDYWDPGAKPVIDRDVSITKVEYLMDGQVLLTHTPESPDDLTDFFITVYPPPERDAFYFDIGLVNTTGEKAGEGPTYQDGMIGAFDKKERMETIVDNKSRQLGKWFMDREGSFNIVSTMLPKAILAKLTPAQPSYPPKIVPTVACKTGTGDAATFTWTHNSRAVKYILRIDQKNSCVNKTGNTVPWLCGAEEGFPNNTGDQYYLLNATGENAVCTGATCTITKPVVANAEYVNASIQWVLADNNTTGDAARIGESPSFTCAGTAAAPLRGDYTNDGKVDIFDYNSFIPKFGQTDCAFNLAGPTCVIDRQDLEQFIKQFGAQRTGGTGN
jgi:hypothetical protein